MIGVTAPTMTASRPRVGIDPDTQLGLRRAVVQYGVAVIAGLVVLTGPLTVLDLPLLPVVIVGIACWIGFTRWYLDVWPSGVHGRETVRMRFSARGLGPEVDSALRARVGAAEFLSGLAALASLQWPILLCALDLNVRSFRYFPPAPWRERITLASTREFDATMLSYLAAGGTLGLAAFTAIHAIAGSRFNGRRLLLAHAVGLIGGAILVAPYAAGAAVRAHSGDWGAISWALLMGAPLMLHAVTLAFVGPALRYLARLPAQQAGESAD